MHVKALQTFLSGTIDVSFVTFLKMQRLSGNWINTFSKLSENSKKHADWNCFTDYFWFLWYFLLLFQAIMYNKGHLPSWAQAQEEGKQGLYCCKDLLPAQRHTLSSTWANRWQVQRLQGITGIFCPFLTFQVQHCSHHCITTFIKKRWFCVFSLYLIGVCW